MRFKMGIKNYKSFKNKQLITFAPITIFVGPNSSGKSSILKMLEYLSRNIVSSSANLSEDHFSNISNINVMNDFSKLTNCNNELPIEINIETPIADLPDLDYEANHYSYSGDALQINYNLNRDGVLVSYNCSKKFPRSLNYPRLKNNKFILSEFTEKNICFKLENIKEKFIKTLSLIKNCDEVKARKRFNKFNNLISKNTFLCTKGFKADVAQYSFAKTFTPTNDYYDLLSEFFQQIIFASEKSISISKYKVSLPNIFENTNYHEFCKSVFRYLPMDPMDNLIGADMISDDDNSDVMLIMDSNLDLFDNIRTVFKNHLTKENRNVQIQSLENTLWHFLLEIHIQSHIREYELIINHTSRFINPTIQALFGSFLFLPPVRQKPEKIYLESNLLKTINGNDSYLINPFKQKLGIKGALDNVEMVNSYLSDMGLTQRIKIRRIKDKSINNLYLFEVIDKIINQSLSLKDVGYGYSQILPILFSLTNYYTGRRTIIEQPELHLHPALQAKLSKIIVRAITKNQRGAKQYYGENKNILVQGQVDSNMVILETHSEYLIRKLLVYVAKGKLKPQDLSINYVGKYKNGNSYVKRMVVDKQGFFEDKWPEGFFDNSLKLTEELWNARKIKGE